MSARQANEYNAYIDEAGDEGVNTGGTDWFLLAALIVPTDQDLSISGCVDRARKRLRRPPDYCFHWKQLSHDHKKVMVEEISKEDSVLSIVAVNKLLLSRTETLQHPPWLYHYCTRYLVERISWYVGEHHGRVELVFSNRSHMRYQDLKAYLRRTIADPDSQIRDVIDDIRSERPQRLRLLQAADAVAGAAINALEANAFGHCENAYLLTLKDSLYRRKGNLLSYGFKILGNRQEVTEACNVYRWLQSL